MKKRRASRNLTGSTIHRLRLAAEPRITQEDMVGRLARFGVQLNQSQVAKIESGERSVSDFEVAAFARALKVSVEALFQR